MGTEEVPFSQLLSHVVDNRGRTCPTSDSGIPLIATNCIDNARLYPSYEKVRFVSQETYDSWFRGHPLPGDILFVNKGTPGRVALVPDPVTFCIAQDMVAVRADPARVYPRYLLAALRSEVVQERIGQLHVGTMIPHLKKSDFDRLMIPIPPSDQQQLIGDSYFSFSAKIELNRRMSETLEAMARALFKSWFVDFDPVRAKAEGRETGLPEEIAGLFPNEFEESHVGAIPVGWAVRALDEIADFTRGRSYKSAELNESDTALVTLKSFARGGGYRADGLKPFVGQYKRTQVVQPGEILIACTDVTQSADVIGRAAMVRETSRFRTLVASQDTMIVRPRDRMTTRSYLYLLCRDAAFVSHSLSHTRGTTVLHLGSQAIPSFRFCEPPRALVQKFDEIAGNVLLRAQDAQYESEILAGLREMLLPRLMTGSIAMTPLQVP